VNGLRQKASFPTWKRMKRSTAASRSSRVRPRRAGIPWEVGEAQPRLREIEALGAFPDVLDIGCGLGDNAIFLGVAWTPRDWPGRLADGDRGCPGPRSRSGVSVRFEVAARRIAGYERGLRTRIDSGALTMPRRGRPARLAHRAATAHPSGARWFYCFSPGASTASSPQCLDHAGKPARHLWARRWRIDFLGPPPISANLRFHRQLREGCHPELLAQMPPEGAEGCAAWVSGWPTIIPPSTATRCTCLHRGTRTGWTEISAVTYQAGRRHAAPPAIHDLCGHALVFAPWIVYWCSSGTSLSPLPSQSRY